MVRLGLSSEQTKKQKFLVNGERNSSSKFTVSKRVKKKISVSSFYPIGTIGETAIIPNRRTEVYFVRFH